MIDGRRLVAASWGAAILLTASLAAASQTGIDPKARLGERLFFDTSLSADGSVSCATCHRPDRLFADGRARAVGIGGREGSRNTPSLLDVAEQKHLFWEGRQSTLESQALEPLTNPIEHGLRDEAQLLRKLDADSTYRAEFIDAFGSQAAPISADHVRAALAAYQRTLRTGEAPIDRFLAGDASALSAQARAGWEVFAGQAECARCHVADRSEGRGARPMFTDHGFHSIGVGQARIARKLPQLVTAVATARRSGARVDHQLLADPDIAALGRFVVTLELADLGRFKTPGLRNVALTAPYMHDGSVETLQEAVDREIYYRGHHDGRPLILTPQERDDLLHFLVEGLTTRGPNPIPTQGDAASRIVRKQERLP